MTKAEPHNHEDCAVSAMATAEAQAHRLGVKLTPLRRQVLSLICQSHKPVGAYHLLAELSRVRGDSAAPPTVYRALDFLVEHGLAHKIDSLNAFVACFSAGHAHRGIFLICEKCADVQEITDKPTADALGDASSQAGFAPTRSVIEVHGACRQCRTA